MKKQDYTVIKLNVGGKRFETLRSTLLSVEGTYFTGLLGDCENPSNDEYFIDRDGDKFVSILNYLRGDKNNYIDPNEAAFYCLPQASRPFHEDIQKDIAFCRNYLEKYQHAIIAVLRKKRLDSQALKPEINMVKWALFNSHPWTESLRRDTSLRAKNNAKFQEYEEELIKSFPPNSALFDVLLSEVTLFWKSQGLICKFEILKPSPYCNISFSWRNDTKELLDKQDLESIISPYSSPSNGYNKKFYVTANLS